MVLVVQLARYALDEMMKQLVTGADIGIYDATNSSVEVRCVCCCISSDPASICITIVGTRCHIVGSLPQTNCFSVLFAGARCCLI